MNKELIKEGHEIQLNVILAELSVNSNTDSIGTRNLVWVFSVQFLLLLIIQLFMMVMLMLMLVRVMMLMFLTMGMTVLRFWAVCMRLEPSLRNGKTRVENAGEHWLLSRPSCLQSFFQRNKMTTGTHEINTVQEPGNIIVIDYFKLNLFSNKNAIFSEQAMSVLQSLLMGKCQTPRVHAIHKIGCLPDQRGCSDEETC